MKTTALENQVLENIAQSEFMDYVNPEEMINYPVWVFSVTNENKKLAGALGSLVKKKLVWVENGNCLDGDTVCAFTEEGFKIAKENLCIY